MLTEQRLVDDNGFQERAIVPFADSLFIRGAMLIKSRKTH